MDWVESYVNAVIGHLPEGERAEVKKELFSNIMDMLPDDPTEAETKAVLRELGNPRKLAEEYRQNPRYLIGPAVYSDYLRTLQIVVPIAAVVGLVIGAIVTYFELDFNGLTITNFSEIISEAIGSGISLALQGIVWTTIGFVIFERTGVLKPKKDDWTVEELVKVENVKLIPLGDTIAEIVVQIGVIGFVIWAVLSGYSFVQITGVNMPVFQQSFVDLVVPVIIFCCVVELFALIFKLRYRRWNALVSFSSIISTLITTAAFILLCAENKIFTTEVIDYFENREWSNHDLLRFFGVNNGSQALPPVIFNGLVYISLIATVISIGVVLYRFFKDRSIANKYKVGEEF